MKSREMVEQDSTLINGIPRDETQKTQKEVLGHEDHLGAVEALMSP